MIFSDRRREKTQRYSGEYRNHRAAMNWLLDPSEQVRALPKIFQMIYLLKKLGALKYADEGVRIRRQSIRFHANREWKVRTRDYGALSRREP
jgi:hypothetical protein